MNKKACILIVDDQEDILQAARDILEIEGYTIITAAEGSAALKKVEEHHPDLVITDVVMPDMEGSELIQALRRVDRKLPVIVMSGNPVGVKFFEAAGIFGAKASLVKPFSRTDLLTAVDSVFHL